MNENVYKVVMKNKVNKKPIIKRMIYICWAILIISFILRIIGIDKFEPNIKNELFIQLCNLTFNNQIIQYFFSVITSGTILCLFLLAILRLKFFKNSFHLYIVLITIMLGTCIKSINYQYGIIVDIWQCIILPMILLGKPSKKWFRILQANCIEILFQILIVVTRFGNIEYVLNNWIGFIVMLLDVFILHLLYYLYSIRKKEVI